ncbi:WYL domain-containing protein [Prosthecobacter algae]
MERLRFVERCAFWRGVVNRQDLVGAYGLSATQATSDLQKFQELNPGALNYNLNKKRYEGSPSMRCTLHKPRIEEAIALCFGSGDAPSALTRPVTEPSGQETSGFVAGVELPLRTAAPDIQRAVFLGAIQKLRVQIEYTSMTGKKPGWRWIAPHAFGHNGYRWHVRAWCEQNEEFRDFVLSRIKAAHFPIHEAAVPVVDSEWNKWVTVKVIPGSGLSEDMQKGIITDYSMRSGKLIFEVRKAMLKYTLRHLGLPTGDTPIPPQLELLAIEE